ncbi:exosome complex component RRP40 [Drosophila grimshawi]|uniref:Exosome complex component RRP40 n=1 Tax=Drosophila grimshawi TaxID=7222 RepID=B4JZ82_DROGR|nr:exosome complex component RRP40 [Drosophila grimshawi]EDV94191.1 GH25200 [Drosophila grimshawi]
MSANTSIVMPGERVTSVEDVAKGKRIILGPGLRRVDDKVVASKAGPLRHKEPNTFWVDSYQRRYVPARGDLIIGIVKARAGDMYRVDIGSADTASISYLAFEAATKKNRPDLNPGDLLYARVLNANADIEPELVCVNSNGKHGKLGVLQDGFFFKCSLNLGRLLLRDSCPALAAIKDELPYEIAVGVNGRIWVKAHSTRETVGLANAIMTLEHAGYAEIDKICGNLGSVLQA